jgi:hypothetical protein
MTLVSTLRNPETGPSLKAVNWSTGQASTGPSGHSGRPLAILLVPLLAFPPPEENARRRSRRIAVSTMVGASKQSGLKPFHLSNTYIVKGRFQTLQVPA